RGGSLDNDSDLAWKQRMLIFNRCLRRKHVIDPSILGGCELSTKAWVSNHRHMFLKSDAYVTLTNFAWIKASPVWPGSTSRATKYHPRRKKAGSTSQGQRS
ncbi:hypothetical protein H1C71_005577, partial [Ictidomys tridecemlineatus]